MQTSDYIIITIIVIAGIIALTYYLGRRNQEKSYEAQNLLDQHKMVTPILIVDKRHERPSLSNMPKSYFEAIPKKDRIRKYCIIKGKVGPRIMTLFCDKSVYDVLETKKTYKIQLSGAMILGIEGMNLADKKKKTLREKIILGAQNDRTNN